MLYNIKPENNPKYKETRFALALKVFEIFSLAALVGFLVLSLNAYTIVGFNLLAQP
ncbi:hypothetical protein ACHJH3_11020 [Campylobacter sp. MOP7]|uniref:hypothetical protein n=1 Tax=Campylobacter canis TaxID=3378588 RepID=UPI00387EDCA1